MVEEKEGTKSGCRSPSAVRPDGGWLTSAEHLAVTEYFQIIHLGPGCFEYTGYMWHLEEPDLLSNHHRCNSSPSTVLLLLSLHFHPEMTIQLPDKASNALLRPLR
jgi:hypothetical protein